LARISELVDLLVDRQIGAVFVESSVSDRNVRALFEGVAAKGHEVRVGGELYSDAMGPDGTYEGTWIGMNDHNVTTLTGALGGDAPACGMDVVLMGLYADLGLLGRTRRDRTRDYRGEEGAEIRR
jgi:manganese/zinc/iron transport system substrate-binding protein